MKSFCGPTSVQMVLFRKDLWIEQEHLAFDLGVIIEEKNKDCYNLPFKRLPDGDPLHGFKFYFFESEEVIKLMKKFEYSLQVLYYSDIKDFEKLIIDTISQDQDMIINYKWAGITWNDYQGGHYVVLSSYDSDKKEVTICDPTPRAPNYWTVPLNELHQAMSGTWDGRERGVIILRKD